jgi:hypothetical protein
MNDRTTDPDQTEELNLAYDITDEALEAAAGNTATPTPIFGVTCAIPCCLGTSEEIPEKARQGLDN